MSVFLRPEHGNADRRHPNNSVRNLIRWLNRQARERKAKAIEAAAKAAL